MLDNDYIVKNSRLFLCSGWFYSHSEASVHCNEMFKPYALSLVSNLQSLEWLVVLIIFNPLTPNDSYNGRTAPLTSKRCIFYIYSTNIGTECF